MNLLGKLENLSGKISDYDIDFPSLIKMPMEMLKSFGLNKNDIINKLNKNPDGSTLTRNEKQAVAGLIAAGRDNPDLFKGVPQPEKEGWTWKPEYSEKLLQDFFDDKYQKLGFDTAEDYYEDLVKQYETGKPTGFGGIFGVGEERTEGLTREQVEEKLDPEDRHWMKVNRPDLYYKLTGTPQTSGGIADLAGQQLMSTEGLGGEDLQKAKDFNQQVFNARNDLDRIQGDRGGGGGGIMGAAPAAFTDVNNNGVPDYLEAPAGGTAGTPAGGTAGTSTAGITGATGALANIGSGNIGYVDPNTGQYTFGNIPSYSQYAQYTPSSWNDGGIVGLERGGYLDDYNAADSLMFKDPQEDEEW